MKRQHFYWVMLSATLLCGCQIPYWMRVPMLAPSHPQAERESYDLHDPLPDSSYGPDISGRPREAQVQRSMPRRTLEAASPSYLGGESAPAPTNSISYPGVVVP